MAHRLCFPAWLLFCWLLVTVAEGIQSLHPLSLNTCAEDTVTVIRISHESSVQRRFVLYCIKAKDSEEGWGEWGERELRYLGQQVPVTPPGASQNNGDPTECQIFTLTPPPVTRSPVTRVQAITRTPRRPTQFFLPQVPRIPFRFPNRSFFPPRCNHRFQFRPFFGPRYYFPSRYGYYRRRSLRRASSSEES